MHIWPSAILREVLSGHMALEDAPKSVQSWATLEIYEAARLVCNAGGLEARRTMLAKIPAKIRPHVEAEVKRLWTQPPTR